MSHDNPISRFIVAANAGDSSALGELYQWVYGELHRLAKRQRRRWNGSDTIDTTSLLHESFVKLVDQGTHEWADLKHFFAVAARAMRHVLIDYAKKQGAQKRGGDLLRVEWNDVHAEHSANEILFTAAKGLERLEKLESRCAAVFEMRFFFGFTVEETASLLAVSRSTVKRDWGLATSFLRFEIEGI